MLNFIETFIRKCRHRLSRSELLIKLLGLPKSQEVPSSRGLVLLQIDGLGRHQFERAMAQGNLPFLKQLMDKHKYRLDSLYSGMPSSTPAVTAELLYGIKTAVPAFSFYDRTTNRIFRMFDPNSAKQIQQRLEREGEPLLAGGSAYTSIYTGGAAESHLCAASVDWNDLFRLGHPLHIMLLFLLNFYSAIRTLVLLVVEFVLALVDCVQGVIAGRDLWKELKFVPSRVGVCILMRELATIGAKMDVTRGVPVTYIDFIGYDEQSHRRGPTSAFAHWSLQGIDNAIERIWKPAQRSPRRDYDVWIFSDHGNEDTRSYVREQGRTIQEAVAEALDAAIAPWPDHRGIQSKRMKGYTRLGPQEPTVEGGHVVVTSMGPIGHVYLNEPVDPEHRPELAQILVERAQIPLVLFADGPGRARAWTKDGSFSLPDQAASLLPEDHPFLDEVTQDLIALCQHPEAGDFVISGWRKEGQCLTFPIEGGSHAGPGVEETHAFLLAPEDIPLPHRAEGYPRLLSVRQAALAHLGRTPAKKAVGPVPTADSGLLRVLTYNVHTCIGIDGKLSPHRIARVIARYQPDVVALQEVDVGRLRTGHANQADLIARLLEMEYHFHPAMRIAEEAYGDCILSRVPMRLVKTGSLPMPPAGYFIEPRGALWVALEVAGRTVHFINTHLGLRTVEKKMQIDALLGQDWIGSNGHADPFIFCGDFNASPRSNIWKLCTRDLRDAQTEAAAHIPRGTWFGHVPLARIDHIFVSPQVEVVRVDVGNDYLSRTASDHRPLFAELRIGP